MTRALRILVQYTLGWAFCTVYIPLIMLVSALTLRRSNPTLGAAMVRLWGRTMLRISGVHLALDPRAVELVSRRETRVLTFNHASTLDLFVGAALMPPGGVVVAKREIVWMPFIGQALLLLDAVLLDRGNRDRAAASLHATATRMRRGRLSAMIAPEGTRSRTGEVGPFKLGALHLARDVGAPIHPLVLHGCAALWPRSSFVPRPGVVRIEALEPVPADALAGDLHAVADALRRRYLTALSAAASLCAQNQ